MIALGVDPGRSAGAVVVVDTTARRCLLSHDWRTLRRVGGNVLALRTWTPERGIVESTQAAALGAPWPDLGLLTAAVLARVEVAAVEGIIWHGRGGPSTLVLAEAAGEAVGWCRSRGWEPQRPPARVWRHAVLGLPPRTDAADAERYALRMTTGPRAPLVALPSWAPGHAAEAACIAWYAGAGEQAAKAG